MSRLVDDMAREASRFDSLYSGFRAMKETDLACVCNNAAHALRAAIAAVEVAAKATGR